jgi:hypothetical protein
LEPGPSTGFLLSGLAGPTWILGRESARLGAVLEPVLWERRMGRIRPLALRPFDLVLERLSNRTRDLELDLVLASIVAESLSWMTLVESC